MPLGQRTALDVNEVVKACVEFLHHQALFHNIRIVQHLSPNLPQVFMDPSQIQQVVLNLVLNAAEATQSKADQQ